jgi:hypothetical protein
MLPRAFKSVLFLDVFGWVSQKGSVDLSQIDSHGALHSDHSAVSDHFIESAGNDEARAHGALGVFCRGRNLLTLQSRSYWAGRVDSPVAQHVPKVLRIELHTARFNVLNSINIRICMNLQSFCCGKPTSVRHNIDSFVCFETSGNHPKAP